ncbi:AFG1-like ATPase-domain-containing protein [Aspergillus pseudotamarii]|uniref:AFG1-like ATPase-domain-containing protein n=1 Tax=Aspergillus pseudotamarii TaxID=132259 RepID=A0A5N6S9X4_ASPPS|nr:AFG1-like ATPase-domain-containing protein [Aspergillus pseudotamarii]KAE8131518.1 AFG1-like ATPase-domain-containing protein [Aspergillus pseudotamarii]
MPVSGSSARLCVDYIPATLGSRRVSILPRGTRPAYVRQCRRNVHQPYASVNRSQTPTPAIVHLTRGLNIRGPRPGHEYMRQYATAAANEVRSDVATELQGGPLKEYDARVQQGRLRDDPYQRQIIGTLQDLHERLRSYNPPAVIHPNPESLDLQPKTSFLGSLFGRGKAKEELAIPENLPKGLYMYGDVGCGKTMLMDLFYETLPSNIVSKSRIHFHNFMQDVHKRMHVVKMRYGNDFDALPLVAAAIAEKSSVLCFDEFQCTDVADAMILRRLLESLMSHGVVLITTSNRHPDDLYKNGIQRESFIPCINLLKTALDVINLNSPTDYRKIPRPPSGVYHHPLGQDAEQHAQKWFEFLGDPKDPPHPATQEVWGRKIEVPLASGRAAQFSFQQLIGRATGAADYLELVRNYDAFIITDVPGMTLNQRDLARRFITFIDAVYESRAKLVLTTEVPLTNLFLSEAEMKSSLGEGEGSDLSDAMRMMMDDLGLSMQALKSTSIFSGDEERFAFARALSRLSEMGSKQWVERGLGVGLDAEQGKSEHDAWMKARSHWSEDNM